MTLPEECTLGWTSASRTWSKWSCLVLERWLLWERCCAQCFCIRLCCWPSCWREKEVPRGEWEKSTAEVLTKKQPTLRCTWAPAPFCFRSVSKQGHGGNPGVCHLKILPSSWSIHLIWRHNSFLNSSCVGRRTGGFLKATSLQLEKHCRIRLQAGMPGSVFLKAEGGWQCPSGC